MCIYSSVLPAVWLVGFSCLSAQQAGCSDIVALGLAAPLHSALLFSAVRHGWVHGKWCYCRVRFCVLSATGDDAAYADCQPGTHASKPAGVLCTAPADFTQSPFWAPQASIMISWDHVCCCKASDVCLLQPASNLRYGNVCVCLCRCCNHSLTLAPEPFVWQPGFWGCSFALDCCDTAELMACPCCGLRLAFALVHMSACPSDV